MNRIKTVIVLVLLSVTMAATSQSAGDRFAFTTIYANPPNDNSFGGGYSIYSAVWPLFEKYPKNELFQTGLVSVWMNPQPTGNEPEDDFYNTIEGGLGWWTDIRFGHESPKFIMGGVSNGFYSWANGPGAGRAEIEDGFRDWSAQNGMLDVAQLSHNVLWPPDGLNMATSNNGNYLGYGYLPLPLTEEMETTSGINIKTGNQSWTLFLNTQNFKGPVAFFLPTFWTKPVLENPELEGLFLDIRPADPVSSYGIESATLPVVHAMDEQGTIYAKALPTHYPISGSGESILLNNPMVYSRDAYWNNVQSWFEGGSIAPTEIPQQGQLAILFDTEDESGAAFFDSRIKLVPNGETEDDEFLIESDYLQPYVRDNRSWGYKVNTDIVNIDNEKFKTPEYFRLDKNALVGNPVNEATLSTETGLISYQFESNTDNPIPYLTPLELDCPWYDPSGPWLNPGPTSGPFKVSIEDGSTLTYYWYKFVDQPSVVAAALPQDQKEILQSRIERIHTHWHHTDPYLPAQTSGVLAALDQGLIVEPPSGLEVGYVPIVTRQEKTIISDVDILDASNRLHIYPNPSNSIVFFSEEAEQVYVFSLNGGIILSAKSTMNIDISGLEKGIYFIQTISKNGTEGMNTLLIE